MSHPSLVPYGWSDRWAAHETGRPGHRPARVVRHDGAGLVLATDDGIIAVPFLRRLDPAPTVGDWIELDGDEPIEILPRASLLSRRAADGEVEHALAANVDV